MTSNEFAQKITENKDLLFGFALKLTRSTDDAKDLYQETMFKAFKHRTKFSEETNLKAWLYTIMRNTFINDYRKRSKFSKSDINIENSLMISNESALTPVDLLQYKYIQSLISELKTDFSYPLNQYVQGYKYKEIAQDMDLPIGTVKSRIFEARKKLIHQLR